MLWLGNSYTYVNDVPRTVESLSIADNLPKDLHYDEHTEPGWSWEDHANSEVNDNIFILVDNNCSIALFID